MSEQYANHANRLVFTEAEAQALFGDQPYISHISFNDWSEGHPHLMHCHPKTLEMLLLYRGHGRYSIGTHQYTVEAGDVILCNAGELHDEFPQTGEVYQTLCLGIEQLSLPGLPPNHLLPDSRVPVFHAPPQFSELSSLLLMIERHAKAKKPRYQMLCQHLAMAVLELTCQMLEQTAVSPVDVQNELCVQAEDYIYRHYTEDLTIEQLGRQFSVSPYHLAHVFKQHTGYTIKQYILRRRIGEAQNLLIFSQDGVAQIARQVGFDDAGYFSRVFTKFVGMPPSEYREYRKMQVDGPE